jgi:hypothetical protein
MARNNTEGISQVVNPLILVTLRSRASQILVVFDPPLAVAVSFPSCIHIGQNWMQLIMNAGKADWPFECATTNKNDMRVSLIAVTKNILEPPLEPGSDAVNQDRTSSTVWKDRLKVADKKR